MKYVELKSSNKKEYKFVPLGDIHLGAENCNLEKLYKDLKKIKKMKASILLMGDLIENSSRISVGTEVYNQKLNPTEQIKEITELFKDQHIIASQRGNHEKRAWNVLGVDIGEIIADNLKTTYVPEMGKYQAIVGKEKYNFFAWHPRKNASSTPARINIIKKQAEWIPECELFMLGHMHDLYHVSELRNINNAFQPIHYVLTGSYLDWDNSYAEELGLRPTKLGAPLITLSGEEHKIEVDLEW